MPTYHCWIAELSHEDDAIEVEAVDAAVAAKTFAIAYRQKEEYECPDSFEVTVLNDRDEVFTFTALVSYVPTIHISAPH
jgi:hypothetical protein